MIKAKALGLAVALAVAATGAAWAQGDAAKGGKVFKKCKACHTVDGKKGPKNFIGSYIDKDKAKTKMAFPGLKKDADVENLIAYLKQVTQ